MEHMFNLAPTVLQSLRDQWPHLTDTDIYVVFTNSEVKYESPFDESECLHIPNNHSQYIRRPSSPYIVTPRGLADGYDINTVTHFNTGPDNIISKRRPPHMPKEKETISMKLVNEMNVITACIIDRNKTLRILNDKKLEIEEEIETMSKYQLEDEKKLIKLVGGSDD